MIDLNTINAALAAQISAYAGVLDIFKQIHVGVMVNEEERHTPWCGCYRAGVKYEPRVIGGGSGRMEAYPQMKVVIQASSLNEGVDTEQSLDDYVKLVLDAIMSDVTLGGTVHMTNDLSVEYDYVMDEREELLFQTAIVTINSEVSAA